MDVPRIEELEVAAITDDQAAAIGRLSISFNFVEESISYAITFMLSTDTQAEGGVLLNRLSFQQKVERLSDLIEFFRSSLELPTKPSEATTQVEKWAYESLQEWKRLKDRIQSAAKYRNSLIHALIEVDPDQRKRLLLVHKGRRLDVDAASIALEARRLGGLGIQIVTFGQQFQGSVRNFKKLRNHPRRGR